MKTRPSSYAPCPASTGFFVANCENQTIVIPTSEVLRACYAPTGEYLAAFLTSAKAPSEFTGNGAVFTGLCFAENPGTIFPFRVARNRERAEYEIAQLLPRACAEYHRSGSLPILIRPPFVGKVALRGTALEKQVDTRQITLFVSCIEFLSITDSSLNNRRPRPFQFAPALFRNAAYLWEINASSHEALHHRRYHDLDLLSDEGFIHERVFGYRP